MKPFAEQIESLVARGYGQAAAQAKLRACLDSLIFSNRRVAPTNVGEIVVVLRDVFTSRQFMRRLASAKANWLQTDPVKATERIVRFLELL